MLLRNINPPKLCNGNMRQVKFSYKYVIEATIITGAGKRDTIFIPRIPLIPSDYHFNFIRPKFPVKVCFAMTLNNAQSQT